MHLDRLVQAFILPLPFDLVSVLRTPEASLDGRSVQLLAGMPEILRII